MPADPITTDTIASLLPPVMAAQLRVNSPESALLDAMHCMLAPAESAMHALPRACNPRTCPDRFIPLLVRWLDLDRIFTKDQHISANPDEHRSSASLGHIRELCATALTCSRWRGTEYGLLLFLRTITGEAHWHIDDADCDEMGKLRPFHITVSGPRTATHHRRLAMRVISSEKPAYVTASLRFDGEDGEEAVL